MRASKEGLREKKTPLEEGGEGRMAEVNEERVEGGEKEEKMEEEEKEEEKEVKGSGGKDAGVPAGETVAGEGEREQGEGEEDHKGEEEGEKEVSMDISEVPEINVEGRKLEDEEKVTGREEEGERRQEEETPSNEVAKEVSVLNLVVITPIFFPCLSSSSLSSSLPSPLPLISLLPPPSSQPVSSSARSSRSEDSTELVVSEPKRRKSDGELQTSPVKHKPPVSPSISKSTTSSPLVSRKHEGGVKRDPSPTPSSGESETSSSISAGTEPVTPKTGPQYNVGEKVRAHTHLAALDGS